MKKLILAALLTVLSIPAWAQSDQEIGTTGTSGGCLWLDGSTSGQAKICVPATAGTPTLILGTSSGTPATTASTPLVLDSTTGNLTLGGLSGTPANGQLPIGNGSGFALGTLTAGSNITITNGAGSITVASTSGSSVLRDFFSGFTMLNDPTTTTTIDIVPGEAADSTNTVMMTETSNCDVNLANAGANGLDTGSVAATVWYGYFIINGSSGTSCIASLDTHTSITGNGSSTGATTIAGSTTVTLSSSETLDAGTVIYFEGGTNGGFSTRIATTATGTSFTTADPVPLSLTDVTVAWDSFANGNGPTLPSGYTYFRLIGEMETSALSVPKTFVQHGNIVSISEDEITTDASAVSTPTNPGTVFLLSVPRGMAVHPLIRGIMAGAASGMILNPEVVPDTPTGTSAAPGADVINSASIGTGMNSAMAVTNGVGEIRIVLSATENATLFTPGWVYTEARGLRN